MRSEGPVWLSQAYRPFFPLAALASAVAIIVWLAGLSGMAPLPANPTLWHAHEMLFGFAIAIILGFSLTAAMNWTGMAATTPRSLSWLVCLWGGARVAALLPGQAGQLIWAGLDVLVLPLGAALITRVLLASRNQRNYVFIPLLWGMALVNLGFHASWIFDRVDLTRQLITLSAWLVGFLMVFMGGRVIPFFSGRRLNYQPIQWPTLNWVSTLSALATALLSLTSFNALLGAFAALASVSSLFRVMLWQPWRTLSEPMLWILHLGYLWLGVAFGLLAALKLGLIAAAPSLPLHALLAGGLGCLGLGMMTRVALGHSGQKIEAAISMRIAFVLVVTAALFRIASYGPWPWAGLPSLTISASLWALALGIYFIHFAPRLWSR